MHKSITQSANRLAIALWFVGTATLFLIYREDTIVPIVAGAVVGVFAGSLQARALWVEPDAFARTTSALDVRRRLTSSWSGKLSVAFMWLGAAVIAWLAWSLSRAHVLGAFIAGYLALMLVRDIVTYPVLARVQRAQDAAG